MSNDNENKMFDTDNPLSLHFTPSLLN